MLLVHLLNEHGADLLLPAGNNPISVARSDLAPLATFISAPPGAVPLALGAMPAARTCASMEPVSCRPRRLSSCVPSLPGCIRSGFRQQPRNQHKEDG